MNIIARFFCAREVKSLAGHGQYSGRPFTDWVCEVLEIREQLGELLSNPTRYGVQRGNVVDYMPALERVRALGAQEDAVFSSLACGMQGEAISLAENLLRSKRTDLRLFAIGLMKNLASAKDEVIPILERLSQGAQSEKEREAASSAIAHMRSEKGAQPPSNFKLVGIEVRR